MKKINDYYKVLLFLMSFWFTSTAVFGQCTTPPAGARWTNPIDAGTLTLGTTFTNTVNTAPGNCYGLDTLDNYGSYTDDVFYKFKLKNGGKVHITNNGTSFRTLIAVIDTRFNLLQQTDYFNATGNVSDTLDLLLPAGTYFVLTAGYGTASGNIQTKVTLETPSLGANLDNPINAGTLTNLNPVFVDTKFNYAANGFYNIWGTPDREIYYSFTLTQTSEVLISACESNINAVLYLLDAGNNQVATSFSPGNGNSPCNLWGTAPNQRGYAYIRRKLDPGIYYVIVEGEAKPGPLSPFDEEGELVTRINVNEVTGLINYAYNPEAPVNVKNYIITTTMLKKGITTSTNPATLTIDDVQQQKVYFDGLGRPVQEISVQGSPNKHDVIVPIEYDQFGREAKKRLPYVDTLSNSTGNYRPTAFADQMAFYANPGGSRWNAPAVASSTKPYATTLYEASPLNKVNEQGAPGMVWQPASTRNTADSGRTVLTEYATNNQVGLNTTPGESNKGSRKVAWYNAAIGNPGSAGNYMRTLERNSTPFYPSDSLSVTIVKDENWVKADGCLGTVEEYKDKEGHVVLKRTYNKTPDNQVEMLSTYYVHDDFGNLCFVLTPKADPDRADGMPSLTTIEQLCYQYRYDERQRLVLKRVAGKDWDALFYNKLNQLVCTQDGNQRNKASATQRQEASFTKYDALGRAIMTGTMTVPNTVNTASITTGRANIIAYINSTASLWETKTATGTGYSSTSFPTSEFIPLIMNYYDNHTDIPGLPAIYNQTSSKAGNTRGMLTATTVAVLNTLPALNTPTPVTVPDMLWSVTHYDDEGRVAVTYDQHYKGGIVDTANYDKVTYTYTFTGQADTTVRYHHIKKTSGASLQYTIGNTYKYDHAGRKIETGQQINDNNPGSPGGTPVYLSKLLYNELGQLKEKWSHRDPSMGGRYLGKTAYRYNIRGWLKSLTPVDTSGVLKPDDPFAEELWYNDPGAGYTPQFNGTISRFYNKAAYGFTGSFNYSYDKLNRLTSAIHADANLNETVVYDKMGNITSLTRNGPGNGTLTYTYANSGLSNKLASVTGSTGFTNLTNRTYTYDVNGNALKADSGKTIAYNLLNLPQTVKNSGGTTLATYVYDATGKKLRNISTGGGTTEYVDGIVYTNGVIEYIQTEEGRALVATGGNLFYYQYDFKDYLGNVRGSYQKNTATIPEPALVQEDEYYAFGLRRNIRNSPNNSYLYNGKEIQTDLTDQYDYGARFYDPVIARWNTIDPLAEQMRRYSPYNYVFDNPVNLIDPDGMGPGPAPMVFGVKLDWASAWASSYDEGGDYRNFKTKQKKEISANSEAILKGSLEKDKKAAGSGKGYSNQRPIWYKPWIFETEYTANSMHVNTSYNLNTARTEVTPFTTDENVSKLIQGNIGLTGGKGTKYLLSVLQGLGFLKSDIASSRLSDLIGVGVGWISDVGFRYQDVTTSVDAEKWFGKVRFNGVNGSIIGVEYYGSQTIRMPINSYRIEQIFNTKTGKVLFQGTINRSFSIPKSSNQLPKFNYGKFD